MELLELIKYNYSKKNSDISIILKEILNKESDIVIKEKLSRIFYMAEGYTEYKIKDLAINLNVSKTAIKYMLKSLLEENKIELLKINNTTFIIPIIENIF
ncbi:TPA: hypothetical protein UL242_002537 [Clostridioides difficile]|uniref:Uncharacterized protein n=1 Tax=Clostridioides difficile TaxID=1496 RepID=A0AAN6A7W0_CLODI|nr:hypothetical protein [Clostridioides difficile]EGT3642193.1 hypothetical protein [Clostridioides difficile]EGT3944948.1 hypothetical protein [Clostridioides difficile]MBG0198877.1 hypothetical protein [Clostridioides difficile]MBH7168561.1 hypothetical protein [Clostridioides difficile]MBH7847416.1 hypothetical protein [Clostridioides difficile]